MCALMVTPERKSREELIEARVNRVLKQLPFLPDDALVEQRGVCAVRGRSAASHWRDVAEGRFPKPEKIGRSSRWRVGDLRNLLNGGWPAAGFVDTEKRCFMKPEVGYGETSIQS